MFSRINILFTNTFTKVKNDINLKLHVCIELKKQHFILVKIEKVLSLFFK